MIVRVKFEANLPFDLSDQLEHDFFIELLQDKENYSDDIVSFSCESAQDKKTLLKLIPKMPIRIREKMLESIYLSKFN